jgi:hypothetical protein
MNGDTNYLQKDECIHCQSHQYFSHMTKCHYHFGQYDVADMEYALVDHDTNGGVCGTDMLILEVSEHLVDVVLA